MEAIVQVVIPPSRTRDLDSDRVLNTVYSTLSVKGNNESGRPLGLGAPLKVISKPNSRTSFKLGILSPANSSVTPRQ